MPQLFGYSNMEPVTWTLQIEMLFYGFLMLLLVAGLLDKPLRDDASRDWHLFGLLQLFHLV